MQISDRQLRLMVPTLGSARRAELLPFLNAAMECFSISENKFRIAAFISNLMHESQGLTNFVENLNYSASRLCAVWPRRFPTLASALPYAHNPQALAEKVYGGRMGNTQRGDGWLYRGHGGIQRTGRAAYERLVRATHGDVPALTNPDCVAAPRCAFISDALFWSDTGLNKLADCLRGVRDGSERRTLTSICEKINGGRNGLDERIANYWRVLAVLNREPYAEAADRKLDQVIAASPLIPTPETHTAAEIAISRVRPEQIEKIAQAEVAEQQKAARVIDLAEKLPPSAVRATAQSFWARTGGRVMQGAIWIGALLKAGNLSAWLVVALLAAGVIVIGYKNRADLKRWKALLILQVKDAFSPAA